MTVNREIILRRYDASRTVKLKILYGQLRLVQILIRTLIFNIYPIPVHENAYIRINKLVVISHFFH